MHQSLPSVPWPGIRPILPDDRERAARAAPAPAVSPRIVPDHVRTAQTRSRAGLPAADLGGGLAGALLAGVLAAGGEAVLTAAVASAAFLYLGMAMAGLRRSWALYAAVAAVAAVVFAVSLPAAASALHFVWGVTVLRWARPLPHALRVTVPAWCAFHGAALVLLLA